MVCVGPGRINNLANTHSQFRLRRAKLKITDPSFYWGLFITSVCGIKKGTNPDQKNNPLSLTHYQLIICKYFAIGKVLKLANMGKKYIPGTPEEQLYAAGQLVKNGTIQTFAGILQYTYQGTLADAMDIKIGAFNRRLPNLEKFEIKHFLKLERKMDLEPGTLLFMIVKEREAKAHGDQPGEQSPR